MGEGEDPSGADGSLETPFLGHGRRYCRVVPEDNSTTAASPEGSFVIGWQQVEPVTETVGRVTSHIHCKQSFLFYTFGFWVNFREGFMEMYTGFTIFPRGVNLIFRVESYLGLLISRKLSESLEVDKNVQYINFLKHCLCCFIDTVQIA